jgi:hypothetical protein
MLLRSGQGDPSPAGASAWRLHGGLGMELGGEGDLEEHLLHHIRAVRALELELVALEQRRRRNPTWRCQHAGIAHLARHGRSGQPHGAGGGIARRPGLARAGIGGMAVGAQAGHRPRPGRRVDDLSRLGAEHLRHHRPWRRPSPAARGHRPTRLKLFSSAMQPWISCALIMAVSTSLHGQRRLAFATRGTGQPVRRGENAAQVVGRVTPFGGQPGVVVVQPADDAPMSQAAWTGSSWNCVPGTGRHGERRCRDDRSQQLGALRKAQGQQATAERVHQAVAGGVVGFVRTDFVVGDVVDDVVRTLSGFGRTLLICADMDFLVPC